MASRYGRESMVAEEQDESRVDKVVSSERSFDSMFWWMEESLRIMNSRRAGTASWPGCYMCRRKRVR